MNTSKHVTIFEGPDGAGKSTIAKEYAAQTGARYVHFPALPRVNQSLGRLYVEAMVPALLGHQPVVLDRCWLSETPYGEVHREGRDRLNSASRRMLERLALRCGAVVVKCLPSVDVCLGHFRRRRGQELLSSERALAAVWGIYDSLQTELPVVKYDYTSGATEAQIHQAVEAHREDPHPLVLQSAGCWHAPVVLVGEGFAERKEWDAWYQWPFGSFSGEGCSKWLTDELNKASIRELDLLWVNADQPLDLLGDVDFRRVIALGQAAVVACTRYGLAASVVDHPQYHKRFKAGQQYPLIQRIYDATGA